MPMTRNERRDALGRGAMAAIANALGCSKTWVSSVLNCEHTGKRSRAVESRVVEIINLWRSRETPPRPALTHADVFPPFPRVVVDFKALHRTLHRRAS